MKCILILKRCIPLLVLAAAFACIGAPLVTDVENMRLLVQDQESAEGTPVLDDGIAAPSDVHAVLTNGRGAQFTPARAGVQKITLNPQGRADSRFVAKAPLRQSSKTQYTNIYNTILLVLRT
jgi:hypothetical protein